MAVHFVGLPWEYAHALHHVTAKHEHCFTYWVVLALNVGDVHYFFNKAIYALTACFASVGHCALTQLPIGAVNNCNFGSAFANVFLRWRDFDWWSAQAGIFRSLINGLHQFIVANL